ncbi:hypothetical protein RQP46_007137 [Phenoliferia psychrophenolica]
MHFTALATALLASVATASTIPHDKNETAPSYHHRNDTLHTPPHHMNGTHHNGTNSHHPDKPKRDSTDIAHHRNSTAPHGAPESHRNGTSAPTHANGTQPHHADKPKRDEIEPRHKHKEEGKKGKKGKKGEQKAKSAVTA